MAQEKPLFRKVALSLWSGAFDPSVYGFVDLDVTLLKDKSQALSLIVKALAETMVKNPKLYTMIRWGFVESREEKMITVMVNIPGQKSDDLSAVNIKDAHLMDVAQIKNNLVTRATKVRSKEDSELGPVLNLIGKLPQWLMVFFLKIYEISIYEFKTNLGLKILPYRPFGSIIVSNVGSLGLPCALLPLVPMARATLMVSAGKISLEPKVVNGEICIREMMKLGITFDHRLFDGSHAARMLNDFEKSFYSLV